MSLLNLRFIILSRNSLYAGSWQSAAISLRVHVGGWGWKNKDCFVDDSSQLRVERGNLFCVIPAKA